MQKKEDRGGGAKYIVVRCQNVGSGNSRVTAETHCTKAKEILKDNKFTNIHIQSIQDLDGNAFKINIKPESEDSIGFLRKSADNIFGCVAREIGNKWDYNKRIWVKPNDSNLLKLTGLNRI